MKTRIAFNALSARAGSGISVLEKLLPAIEKIDAHNEYFVFFSGKQNEVSSNIPDKFNSILVWCPNSNPYLRILWEQFIFPFYLLYYKIDVLYSVGNITTLLAPCKILLFMENANPFSDFKLKWPLKDKLRNKLIAYLARLSAKRAHKIRFASNNSMKLIRKKLKINEDKCVMIYHGYATDPSEIEDTDHFKIKFNYILTVGIVAPNKNLETLVRAFSVLVLRYNYDGNLVIIGDLLYSDYVMSLQSIISSLGLNGRVMLLGKVMHKKIASYYANADMFVLTSIVETFGLPVIEAMSYELPLAVSDGEKASLKDCFIPFREICGDAAIYFDPFDPNDIAESVNEVLADKLNRQNRLLLGRIQIHKYKLDFTAHALVEIFNKLGKKT